MDTFENQDGIKSKDRVKNVGEVYTPDNIVKDMCNQTDELAAETYRIESTFLEPACGNGNFIAELVERKIHTCTKISQSQAEFDLNILKVVSSIYGVDIMHDNIVEAKQRIMQHVEKGYNKAGYELSDNIRKSVKYISDRNIILGNMLTKKMANIKHAQKLRRNNIVMDFAEELIFNTWEFKGEKIKRRPFRASDMEIEFNVDYKEVIYDRVYTLGDIEDAEELII